MRTYSTETLRKYINASCIGLVGWGVMGLCLPDQYQKTVLAAQLFLLGNALGLYVFHKMETRDV